jgi:hypothetical protein
MNRSETQDFELKLTDIKNTIYQNIYNNLVYIYKTKGTEKSYRNLISLFWRRRQYFKYQYYGNNATYLLKIILKIQLLEKIM